MGNKGGVERFERNLERPVVDYAGSLGVTLALLLLSLRWGSFDPLGHLTADGRLELYGRLMAPLSIVASIATAGLAVYASASGPSITLMRRVYGSRILKQFRGAATAAGLAVVVLIVAYVLQGGYQGDWSRWLVLGVAIFVAIRAARVLYFYRNVLQIIDEDKVPTAPKPSLDDQPVRRPAG